MGSATTICSDKTGTFTLNQLGFDSLYFARIDYQDRAKQKMIRLLRLYRRVPSPLVYLHRYSDQENAYWTCYFTSRPTFKGYVRMTSAYYLAVRQLEYMDADNTVVHGQSVGDEFANNKDQNSVKDAVPNNMNQDTSQNLTNSANVSMDTSQVTAYVHEYISEHQLVDVSAVSAEEERLWSIVRANSLDFDAWTALIEETEKAIEQSEYNTFADIEAAYKCLETEYGVSQEDIILYGQSVGSGPTLHLAAQLPRLRGVVLHSAILSGLRVLYHVKFILCFDIYRVDVWALGVSAIEMVELIQK